MQSVKKLPFALISSNFKKYFRAKHTFHRKSVFHYSDQLNTAQRKRAEGRTSDGVQVTSRCHCGFG